VAITAKQLTKFHVDIKEPLSNVGSLLHADYIIGNAEAPITNLSEQFNKNQEWQYYMNPEVAGTLRTAGFNAMALANNHAFDRGPGGLRDTLLNLNKAGITTFGAGSDRITAERPLLIETPYGKVGVVNLFHNRMKASQKRNPKATRRHAGIMWLTRANINRGAELARKQGAKWLVGYAHWGQNYKDVHESQERAAKYFAEAGYHLVVGHHPHVSQRVERIGNTWVLYSLGNYVFTTKGRYKEMKALARGLVARAYLGPSGFEGMELTCVSNNFYEVKFTPRICSADENRQLFMTLGPDVRLENDIGRIHLTYPPVVLGQEMETSARSTRRRRRSTK
jgi:poly-gamma-glutamate capsule biosynthesis protein CapA/YwtB (metallophosphatase superfamily)